MSVSVDETDVWLQHLAFAAPRPSEFGPVDGLFYGLLAVNGDGSAGQVAMEGRVSQERKTDWIHILGGYNLRSPQGTTNMDAYVEFRAGPRIPQQVALGIDQPTFSVGSVAMSPAIVTGDNMLSFPPAVSGGAVPFLGLPLYGDPAIKSTYDMVHCALQVNTDLTLYTFSLWGFLVRPQSFFRGVAPAQG